MSEKKSQDLKSKLDLIWKELQVQLPSINLDNENESDFELENHVPFENLLNFENDQSSINDEIDFMIDQFSQFDKASVSDIYSNEIADANSKIESYNQIKTSNLKLIANSKESNEKAAKIAKDIFENTNSNLNMDIFNSINIG